MNSSARVSDSARTHGRAIAADRAQLAARLAARAVDRPQAGAEHPAGARRAARCSACRLASEQIARSSRRLGRATRQGDGRDRVRDRGRRAAVRRRGLTWLACCSCRAKIRIRLDNPCHGNLPRICLKLLVSTGRSQPHLAGAAGRWTSSAGSPRPAGCRRSRRQLGASERTIRRDLADLRSAGFEIESAGDRGRAGARLVERTYSEHRDHAARALHAAGDREPCSTCCAARRCGRTCRACSASSSSG